MLKPPRFGERVLKALIDGRDREYVLGDLAEQYGRVFEHRGSRGARWWYWRQVLGAVVPSVRRRLSRNESSSMESSNGGGDVRVLGRLDALRLDVRLAVRHLVKTPGFTVGAVATLGLGLGLATAIFSVVNGVLLRPLPYREPEKLLWIWSNLSEIGVPRANTSGPQIVGLRERAREFEGFAAMRPGRLPVTGVDGENPEQIDVALTTSNLFTLLGVGVVASQAALLIARADRRTRELTIARAVGATTWSLVRQVLVESGLLAMLGGALGVATAVVALPRFMDVVPANIYDDSSVHVAGVIEHARQYRVDEDGRSQIWLALRQLTSRGLSFAVRLDGDPLARVPDVRRALATVDPLLPISNVRSSEMLVADALSERRLALVLVSAFGIVALLLAVLGTYTLVSAVVTQRSREIGIRMAIGARRAQVVRLVLGGAAKIVVAGVVLGAGIALLATRALRSLLFGVTPTDLTTFVVAAATLVGVAIAAAALPARKAAGISVSRTLRED